MGIGIRWPFRRFFCAEKTMTSSRNESFDVKTNIRDLKRHRVVGYQVEADITITNSAVGAQSFPPSTTAGKVNKHNLLKEVNHAGFVGYENAKPCRYNGVALSLFAPKLGFHGWLVGSASNGVYVPTFGSIAGGGGTSRKTCSWVVPMASIQGRKVGRTAPCVGNAPSALQIQMALDADLAVADLAITSMTVKVYAIIASPDRFGRACPRQLVVNIDRSGGSNPAELPRGAYEALILHMDPVQGDAAIACSTKVQVQFNAAPGDVGKMVQATSVGTLVRQGWEEGGGPINIELDSTPDDESETIEVLRVINGGSEDAVEATPCVPKVDFPVSAPAAYSRYYCYVPYDGERNEKSTFAQMAVTGAREEGIEDIVFAKVELDSSSVPSGRKGQVGLLPYVAFTADELEAMAAAENEYAKLFTNG